MSISPLFIHIIVTTSQHKIQIRNNLEPPHTHSNMDNNVYCDVRAGQYYDLKCWILPKSSTMLKLATYTVKMSHYPNLVANGTNFTSWQLLASCM